MDIRECGCGAARYTETLSNENIMQNIKVYLESMLQKYPKNQHWQLPLIEKVFVASREANRLGAFWKWKNNRP